MNARMQIVRLREEAGGHPVSSILPETESALVLRQQRSVIADFHHLLRVREENLAALEQAHLETLKRLAMAAEFKDDDTGTHVVRMARYSAVVARAYGLDAEYCRLLEQAAPMHDVGKIGIPDSILKKQGPLTAEEWTVMRRHPEFGARILGSTSVPVLRMAVDIALGHHEKFDGSGYPHGLKGEQIPLVARIVAVADFFDALTTDRCYRKAMPYPVAFAMLEDGRHTHFDPKVVTAFFKVTAELFELRQAIDAGDGRKPS